jgi:hypothetical protein
MRDTGVLARPPWDRTLSVEAEPEGQGKCSAGDYEMSRVDLMNSAATCGTIALP